MTGSYRCIKCERMFDDESVKLLLFFPDTSICDGCYRKGQQLPYNGKDGWCFGKENQVAEGSKKVLLGYDLKSEDCKRYCPDRFYCPLYISGRILSLQVQAMSKITGETIRAVAKELKDSPIPKIPVVKVPEVSKASGVKLLGGFVTREMIEKTAQSIATTPVLRPICKWAVEVNGIRFPVGLLVRIAAQVPEEKLSRFSTFDAIRVLKALGFNVFQK